MKAALGASVAPPAPWKARDLLFAAVFFSVAAIVMTWPLASDPARLAFDPGLPYFVAWILHWDWHAIHTHAPLFDANIFHPARLSLLFSENLLGIAVLGFPLFAAGAGPLLVENLLLLAGIALMGFAAWLLAYDVTRDRSASLIAGVIFAFAPARTANLQFFQLQWAGFIPLILLFLRRWLRDGRRLDLVLFAVFFAWNGFACVYWEIFAAIGVAGTCVLAIPGRTGKSALRAFGGVAAALAASAFLLAPVYLGYARVAEIYGFRRSLSDVEARSPGLTALLNGGLASRIPFVRHSDYGEWQLFPGLIPIAILAAAAIGSRSEVRSRFREAFRREPVRWALGMTVLGVLVALGPRTFFYRALYRLIPGMGAIRDVARGYVLALAGIGVLCAVALARRRARFVPLSTGALASVLAVFALAEFTAAPLSLFRADLEPSPVSAWRVAHPAAGAMLELPMKTADNIEYVFRSTEHDAPIANGYSGFYPPGFVELTRAVETAGNFSQIEPLLRKGGIRTVVYHGRRASAEESRHFAALFRSGVDAHALEPARFLKSRRESCLVFELRDEKGGFPLAEGEQPDERRTARAVAGRFFADPGFFPVLPEALAFPWPDFY